MTQLLASPKRTGESTLPIWLTLTSALFLLFIALLIAGSLRRPDPPTYLPSPSTSRPAPTGLRGPELVTIDARQELQWQFFSFARGSTVHNPGPLDWDLAFRRFRVITNGGAGFAGVAGVVDLGAVAFDSVRRVPEDGYILTAARSDSVNAALQRWYSYSFTSHLLSPAPRVYAVRTADGRFAKLEFMAYYCPGATPGCVTFRYTYQGGGGSDMVSDPAAPFP